MTYDLRGVGVWSGSLRYGDAAASAAAATELEALGYTALWLPDIGGPLFESLENVLRTTTSITIATGILNLWMQEAALTASEYTRLVATYGHRLLLGIGVSHAPLIDSTQAGRYANPLARTEAYLDALDTFAETVPASDRLLARARAEDAGALGRQGVGHPPVQRDARAHRGGTGRPRPRASSWRPSRPWCSRPTPTRPAPSPGSS